jgi:copper chaperone
MSERRPVVLTVSGMTCSGCVNSVTRVIKRADPAADVQIDLTSGRVEVRTDCAADVLATAVTGAGYEARPA